MTTSELVVLSIIIEQDKLKKRISFAKSKGAARKSTIMIESQQREL
jgi:hypothetical protein